MSIKQLREIHLKKSMLNHQKNANRPQNGKRSLEKQIIHESMHDRNFETKTEESKLLRYPPGYLPDRFVFGSNVETQK